MAKQREKDRGWKQILREVRANAGKTYVKVGILDAKADRKSGGAFTNTQIGLVHEFGSRDNRIPERSFLRSTFDAKAGAYQDRIKKMCELVTAGKLGFVQGLNLIGAQHAADVKQMITQGGPGNWKKLADSTVAARPKHTTNPLLDTGQLRASITHAIVREGEGATDVRRVR